MSLFSSLFPDADPSTVENASVAPDPLTEAEAQAEADILLVDDLLLRHEDVTQMLRDGAGRLAHAQAEAADRASAASA